MNCEMSILDATGHTKQTWDSENADEVAAAKAMFKSLTDKGFRAFRVKPNGQEGEPMTRFDPEAESMILTPQMRGG
jgi:hypothetical protein